MALSDLLVDPERLKALLEEAVAFSVDRAQKALETELDRANTILGQNVTQALSQTGNVASGLLTSAQDTSDRILSEVRRTINSLDGWTATIAVKLSKPLE